MNNHLKIGRMQFELTRKRTEDTIKVKEFIFEQLKLKKEELIDHDNMKFCVDLKDNPYAKVDSEWIFYACEHLLGACKVKIKEDVYFTYEIEVIKK